MKQSEFNVCNSAIRQLKIQAEYQLAVTKQLPQRFPSAFIEAVQEVLKRFEERLSCEPFSPEVPPARSSEDSKKRAANQN